jgi:hypothetical protein
MANRECAAGTGLQIALKLHSAPLVAKRDDDHQLPRRSVRRVPGVPGVPGVVMRESRLTFDVRPV